MNVMKLIGSILVIASSTAMGFYFSSEMKSRVDDLKELRKLVALLRGDIRYANTPLPEAISTIARRHPSRFDSFLRYVSDKLNELSGSTFAEIWEAAVKQEMVNSSLTKKDKADLIHFGQTLGYLDKEMQMNTLDMYLTLLEEEASLLSKTMKEKSYLYNSLGIMAGVFITIVMI